MEDRRFTIDEIKALAGDLEAHDSVFSQLWCIGSHYFNSKIPTACVSFDELGQVVTLEVNPYFWEKLSSTQKLFVICHEMLHVILEHGRRAMNAIECNKDAINVAMDVVVNELLVSGFGFKRNKIDPKNRLCWLDTVFKKRQRVLPNQTFEYYLMKLPKAPTTCSCGGKGDGKHGDGCKGGPTVLDDHSKLGNADTSKLADRVLSKLSPEEQQALQNKLGAEGEESGKGGQQAGTGEGGFVRRMQMGYVPKKKKWESLIKSCMKQMADEAQEETWLAALNRRASLLLGTKIVLPTEIDGDGLGRRALVYMFADTSGSCYDLAPRFWKLALSVPREVFDLKLRCFDTRVYEVNFKDQKFYGFGGTRFDIIENHIQKELRLGNIKKYPDGVFVLTDGYGNRVNPEKPKKWHVLLTTRYTNCLPKPINTYDLSKFE